MFNSEMFPDTIDVPVTLPHIYKDEKGKPVEFHFSFRIETGEDAEKLQKDALNNSQTSTERNLCRFCLLLDKAPEQLSDFPQDDSPLAMRARAYFSEPKKQHLVWCALRVYDKATMPEELFR